MSSKTFLENLFSRRRLLPFWQGLFIALLVVLAYLPTLRNDFIWDDDSYVTQNTTLRDLNGLYRMWFEYGAIPQYYPMVHTTFWIEYHLWGLNAIGYHLLNVLLHATGAILLWRVLRRLKIPAAWLAAAIFALHPVEAESVSWVTERKNVLSGVFYFAAALAYLRFDASAQAEDRNRRWHWYVTALFLFVAALLSKTVTCSLPAALLLIFWWKRGHIRRSDVLPLVPLFALGAGFGLLTAWMERNHVGAHGPDWAFTFVDRCLIAGRALWFYAGKLVWPVDLTFVYPHWKINPALWWQWLFPAATAGVVAGLWLARHRIGRGPLVAVLYFAGTLAPALGFVNVYPMRYSFVADHFQYLAGIGLIILCTAALARLPRIFPAILLLLLGVLTWHQTHIYRDLPTLWRDTLVKNPDCWLANNNLGIYLYKEGRFEDAIQHYHKAIQTNPDRSDAYYDLGVTLAAEGRLDDAIQNYRKAIELNPDYAYACNNLGNALAAQGKLNEAVKSYRRAVQIMPDFSTALNNLGVALAAQGDSDGAIQSYRKAIQASPGNTDAYVNLGLLYGQLGRVRDSVAQYRAALKLNPNLPTALNNLAWTLATSPDDQLRDGNEAVRLAERACELTQYNQPWFVGTLAAAYAEAGRFPAAVAAAERAEQLAVQGGFKDLALKDPQFLEIYRAGKPYREPGEAR